MKQPYIKYPNIYEDNFLEKMTKKDLNPFYASYESQSGYITLYIREPEHPSSKQPSITLQRCV